MKNLWGEFPTGDSIMTPVAILKEQAVILSSHYKGILQGQIIQNKTSGGELSHTLCIVAPMLNDYTYIVVTLVNPLTLYPCRLFDRTISSVFPKEVADADELENALGKILTSDTVKNVIAALVAQSKE